MPSERRPDFLELARAWLVRAQGHSRPEHEKSLADEFEKMWEFGIANAIEAVDAMDHDVDYGMGAVLNDAVETIRALTDKPTDPRGN